MRTKTDLDELLWNLLGTGERFRNGKKKLDHYYKLLMRWKDCEQDRKRRQNGAIMK